MDIREFIDIEELQNLQDKFSDATGLAAIACDENGEYITEGSNFTDFCMKYTRGSQEGGRRCAKCDVEGKGTYTCHAGLLDFNVPIVIEGQKIGNVIGGQILPKAPDEAKFRAIAEEIGVDPDAYVDALHKVPISDEKKIRASAELFGEMVNLMVKTAHASKTENGKLDALSEEINHATDIIETINNNTHSLKSIANKQKMLSLNASIEAARSGEAGVGFAVVAKSMGELSSQSATIYGDIEKSVSEVTDSIVKLADLFQEQEQD